VEHLDVAALRGEVDRITAENFLLRRRRIPTAEAIAYYAARGQTDKARLFAYRQKDTLDVYENGDFMEYYHGEMAPCTGYLRSFDILPAPEGFIFVYPDTADPDRVSEFREQPNFFQVYTEGKHWGELMRCETVADLNELTDTEGQRGLRELIRVNEALHEKRFSQIADMICERGARTVLLAGPSSSGKTTSANRLATQLRVHGKLPVLMSLDDYYIDRDRIPVAPDGSVDLEHINTIDTDLFGRHLRALMEGEEVEIPRFNFKAGKREWVGHRMRLSEESVIIVEGLHGLNPALLPEDLDPRLVFRVYVSPLMPLNLDLHSRIPCSYLRLLRRIVRDYETRGASVQQTLSMWDSVRRGEERWIYPFQENADVIFNSSTLYELAVLKRHIFPLLLAIEPSEPCYSRVRAMVKILNFIHEADVDDEIPPTSVVREFIGGNSFYRK
jgi:uridine kinase